MELRVWQPFYEHIISGEKRFEVRISPAPQDFEVGKKVSLIEYVPGLEKETGRRIDVIITYVVRGPAFSIPLNLVVFGFKIDSSD